LKSKESFTNGGFIIDIDDIIDQLLGVETEE